MYILSCNFLLFFLYRLKINHMMELQIYFLLGMATNSDATEVNIIHIQGTFSHQITASFWSKDKMN